MPSPRRATSVQVKWAAGPKGFAADPIATTDLAFGDWQALGARFVDIEDALGGVSRLAVGHVGAVHGFAFAVLDHGEPVTYLLADQAHAEEVLLALTRLGVDSGRVLERLPAPPSESLHDRVAALEHRQRSILAALDTATNTRDAIAHIGERPGGTRKRAAVVVVPKRVGAQFPVYKHDVEFAKQDLHLASGERVGGGLTIRVPRVKIMGFDGKFVTADTDEPGSGRSPSKR
jgi:hypothetical protein